MQIDSLQKLYVEELRDLHSAERQIIQANLGDGDRNPSARGTSALAASDQQPDAK